MNRSHFGAGSLAAVFSLCLGLLSAGAVLENKYLSHSFRT